MNINQNRIGEVSAGTHGVSLCGALGIEFLFGRFTCNCPPSKRDSAAGVAAVVRVYGVGCINPSAEMPKIVGSNCENIAQGALHVLQEAFQLCQILLRALGHSGGKETHLKEQIHACTNGDI